MGVGVTDGAWVSVDFDFDSDFDGVDTATVSTRYPDLTKGGYLLELAGLKYIKSQKNEQKYLIPEFVVLEASGEEARPAGSMAKLMIKKNIMFAKKVKAFAAALLNRDPSEIKAAHIRELLKNQEVLNRVIGTKVRANAYPETSQKGVNFLNVRWTPYVASA